MALKSLGGTADDRLHDKRVVIARVTTRRVRSITPELAKRLLDTLHDQKHGPPHYRDRGLVSVLADDDQRFVTGLAIEMQTGQTDGVDFILAEGLEVDAPSIGTADVLAEAPNDISSGGSEELIRQRLRTAYVSGVRKAWPRSLVDLTKRCTHVVVRHSAQRDEDNTWATWIGALRSGVWSRAAWSPDAPPLAATWRADGIATLYDAAIGRGVRYEFHEGDRAAVGSLAANPARPR
jgi:hypothetical protein